ncbi:MAG TPA: hypothetical protein H9875_07000 [Candidatus Levilactobacillus faecigallinarum]|uniref:Uncharacterized protein n=1 Tax=Candidatus Levilactobacillus faecigallinarum TaxID=2838638 RepID=A0A9D1U6E4_9LACO|nr:hypothetical protein [Candidatus Levilactobacillus faecigallinarum]
MLDIYSYSRIVSAQLRESVRVSAQPIVPHDLKKIRIRPVASAKPDQDKPGKNVK